MKLDLVNSFKLPDYSVCLCLLTSCVLCNFEMNIGTLLILTIKMNICLMVKAKTDTTMQLSYCSSLTWIELKHLLLSKGFNFNLIKHNQNKGTMGAAKYSCCVLFCQIYGTWNCSKFNCFPGLAEFKDFTLEIPESRIFLLYCLKLCCVSVT